MRCVPFLPFALLGVPAFCASLWQDDFATARRYERWGTAVWDLGEGRAAFRSGTEDAYLVVLGPQVSTMTAETELTLDQRTGTGWTLAGLSLYADPTNHWRLLLVEGPDGKRYMELIETFSGEHQAQLGGNSPVTRLEASFSGELLEWDYGKPYHLSLALTPEGLTGTVTDPAKGAIWRKEYTFGQSRAVRAGRAALMVNGMAGSFSHLAVEGAPPALRAGREWQAGPRGTVAILRDEAGTSAEALATAFAEAGFGATVVPWEQMEGALPWDQLDLLVFADARTLPTGARDRLMEALHCGGKVMCIGAPALSELRASGPGGWHTQGQWARSYYEALEHRPIVLGAGSWERAAQFPEQPASIERDPAGGDAAWKVTTDLKGWDTYRTPATGAFDAEHPLLTFEARGDENTKQLSIECAEDDGARWIAVVELTPEWQSYVLRPMDFAYWFDSPAKNRGGPGDRLQPEHTAYITFGLAASHTPKVRDGRHTYWFRHLAAAPDRGMPEPNFTIPSVEALCPSYKLYPMDETVLLRAAAESPILPAATRVRWSGAAYSPVWRERGRGFQRNRSWRWVPVLEALDGQGKFRGALVSLMIGDSVAPNAVWANVSVADPSQVLREDLLAALTQTAAAMVRGCFLLDGGAEFFSYKPGEPVLLGGTAVNSGHAPQELTLRLTVRDAKRESVFENSETTRLGPGETRAVSWRWAPADFDRTGYEVETVLLNGDQLLDRITHQIEALRTTPAVPDEFVRVESSNFMLGGKPWFFKGINYWASWVAGYPDLQLYQRGRYDPEIIERDLTWLESLGVNALSAVQSLQPSNPEAPGAFRDQLDFLERCERHGIKVFMFMANGWPYRGGDVEKLKEYITRAGLQDHPAVMCWELAWEPIDSPWQGRLDYLIEPWNRWIVERYGSLDNAFADWGFTPELREGQVPPPSTDQCLNHGPWDKYVAAFRRAHSDIICAGYRDIAEPLRLWDPKHLVSFRGGACGIPYRDAFAHIHGTAAPKHMDFLNPEGYNLKTGGWDTPTPDDDIRKGGLVTAYFRFTSREKPIVWMEFGYTVNGIQGAWTPERVHIDPAQLQNQKREYESFYRMFIESGARGAAPWWLPGGFRLGENSDFGLIEPDGSERPAVDVLRRYLPRFDRVRHLPATDTILFDLENHYPDSWPLYSQQYLDLVKAGKVPQVRTAGTDTDSATCPLTAVGGGEYNGHNPPLYLNAEFNRLEVKLGEGPWREVKGDETLAAAAGSRVLCRASVGNLGEAKWLAPRGEEAGGVYLAGRAEYGLEFHAPIAADTPYLGDAEVREFTLIPSLAAGETAASVEMEARGRAYFGERRVVVFRGEE